MSLGDVSLPTIIAFAREVRARAFQDGLFQSGQPANIISGTLWLKDPDSVLQGPLLLFLSETCLEPKDQSVAFHKVGSTAWCGVIDGVAPARNLGRRCSDPDLLVWPKDHAKILEWLAKVSLPATAGNVPFADLNLIGRSSQFVSAMTQVRKFACTQAPVLIEGPTGTGKELVARAIHYLGERHDRPFIPVNCGAIPDSLCESELFGHEKGAFTDAKEAYPGVIGQAHGGTLFLDEIDGLSLRAQIALLRFLQDQQFRSLGGRTIKRADIRIIAATNADLQVLVPRGAFRHDLLFRIAVLTVALPPLTRRPGDIELLVEHFLRKMSAMYRRPMKVLSPATVAAINDYDWPGNVRELENFVHRAFVLTEGPVIDLTSVNIGQFDDDANTVNAHGLVPCQIPLRTAKAQAIAEFEKQYLQQLISLTDGNVTQAAVMAGTERRSLGKLLKKHGISRTSP